MLPLTYIFRDVTELKETPQTRVISALHKISLIGDITNLSANTNTVESSSSTNKPHTSITKEGVLDSNFNLYSKPMYEKMH